jgi:phosphatidylethanolamine/phosphatidyl-N-methylethanolamine N-methyltransferase
MAMEVNPRLAASLRSSCDNEVDVICDSAEKLCRHLGRRSVGGVDAIVSSLPWVCFPVEMQRRILREIRRALRPGGKFSTFAYAHAAWLPSGLKFRREMKQVFAKSEVMPIVWRNLPPAFIYRCEN